MKLFPELNKEEYPEITVGIRKPVSGSVINHFESHAFSTPALTFSNKILNLNLF